MPQYSCPGLYLEEALTVTPPPERCTGVPAFLGYVREPFTKDTKVPHKVGREPRVEVVHAKRHHEPEELVTEPPGLLEARELMHWSQFAGCFGEPLESGWLAYAVRGFFENGGKYCVVVPMRPDTPRGDALREALESTGRFDTVDLLCAPDIFPADLRNTDMAEVVRLQGMVVRHASFGNRFAILDSLPDADALAELEHCARLYSHDLDLDPEGMASSALYYPWIKVAKFIGKADRHGAGTGSRIEGVLTPPCGHIAGIYARTDIGRGIPKAPANERVEGVLDVETQISNTGQALFFSRQEPVKLNAGEDVRIPPGAINCIRAFAGRGIRVWGARTLSRDKSWRYVNVRRLFLAARRWILHYMARVSFEPISPALWLRVQRELTSYCVDLFQRGALKGQNPKQAFYVRCNEDLNTPEVRDSGMLVAEIGLAAAQPYEYIVLRLICRVGGVDIVEPSAAGAF